MKRLCFFLAASILYLAATAQNDNDTSMHKTAVAVCDCLEKANITENTSEMQMQQAFMNCIISSAPDLFEKITSSGDDYMTAGQEIATKLVTEMMKNGCPAFTKIAGAMAMNSGGGFEMTMPAQVQTEKVESAEGTVIKVEERDFTYITLKTTAGRELNFIYFNYVPGSDEWIKDPATKLKNKNVTLSYVESEVYQPKFKQFMNVKQVKALTIK